MIDVSKTNGIQEKSYRGRLEFFCLMQQVIFCERKNESLILFYVVLRLNLNYYTLCWYVQLFDCFWVIVFAIMFADYGCSENDARKKRSADDDSGTKINYG